MDAEFVAVISKLEEQLRAQEKQIAETKRTINQILKVAGQPARYTDINATTTASVTNIHGDAFYGRPLATVVREYLEMRKASNLGSATVNDIFEALTRGGYQFETKNDENAKRGLRISLTKNAATFHKLPSGQYGLLDWYPEKKNERQRSGVVDGNSCPGVMITRDLLIGRTDQEVSAMSTTILNRRGGKAREQRLKKFEIEVGMLMNRMKEDNVRTLPVSYLYRYCQKHFKWSQKFTEILLDDLVKIGRLITYKIPVVEVPGKSVERAKNPTLTPQQLMVYKVLRENGRWMRPKEVGIGCGMNPQRASSQASRILARLCELGFSQYDAERGYKIDKRKWEYQY
jgi:hypothetical protein